MLFRSGLTARRVGALAGGGHLVTVTNRDYYFHTKDLYAGLGTDEPNNPTYLLEPFGRNTAAAVAAATLQIAKTHGDIASQNLLGQLAQEFGVAIGNYTALRDALGRGALLLDR